jgi:hypothetical protein
VYDAKAQIDEFVPTRIIEDSPQSRYHMGSSHPVLEAAVAAVGVQLECEGDLSLLDRPRRMLLVSRTERHPRPDAPWLRATVAAAENLAKAGETLVSGMGRIPYDAALFAARRLESPTIVVLQKKPDAGDGFSELIPRRRLVLWPSGKALTAAQRDFLAAWLSDRASGIYIREGGVMSEVAKIFARRGIELDLSLRIDAFEKRESLRPGKLEFNPDVSSHLRKIFADGKWLTHFTREPDGAWPGESYQQYIAWLCSGSVSGRDAFAALCRILEQKKLLASGRLIAGGRPMVCFSGRAPDEVLGQRRWRRGLLRWSFTPYAIAFDKRFLIERGARAVRYCDESQIPAAPEEQRCFMQVKASGEYDWTAEDEWRVAGDMDFSGVGANGFQVLVAHADEARQIRLRFGREAIALL